MRSQIDTATLSERALIEALVTRYPDDADVGSFYPWHDVYVDTMRPVHPAHGGACDAAALFAEAIMNRKPWTLWGLPSGQPADGAGTPEVIAVLEGAFDNFDGALDHPGLLHMYIHLMELSSHPERALRHGDRLSSLVPGAGHLSHMATHTDVLCGEYENVVLRNARGIAADESSWNGPGRTIFTRCIAATIII